VALEWEVSRQHCLFSTAAHYLPLYFLPLRISRPAPKCLHPTLRSLLLESPVLPSSEKSLTTAMRIWADALAFTTISVLGEGNFGQAAASLGLISSNGKGQKTSLLSKKSLMPTWTEMAMALSTGRTTKLHRTITNYSTPNVNQRRLRVRY
jgi:hypothetical protein